MGTRGSTALRSGLAAAVALAVPACNAALGMDAPALDPCAEHPCEAGAGDATAPGDAGAADAVSEKAPQTGGIRCGGGSFGETACAGQTPCCQTATGDGGATYGCVSSTSACAGFPIACASNADCSGNDVCCTSSSKIHCVPQSSCANNALVCEPDGAADQCPSGWKCSAKVTADGVVSPYFACAP